MTGESGSGRGAEGNGGGARASYPESTLAELYDPLTMPPELSKAHAKLDALVDKLYGRAFATDADRVSHLFALYAASAK